MSDEVTTLPPIAAALAQLRADGNRGALLAVATTDGAHVMLVARLSEVWAIDAGAEWVEGKTVAHVAVRAVW
jgi:hypothetical protein